jgi:hypothetical protein
VLPAFQLGGASGSIFVSEDDAPISVPQPQPLASLDREMVERVAQALFEFVFSSSERLDVKHLWMNCDARSTISRDAIVPG